MTSSSKDKYPMGAVVWADNRFWLKWKPRQWLSVTPHGGARVMRLKELRHAPDFRDVPGVSAPAAAPERAASPEPCSSSWGGIPCEKEANHEGNHCRHGAMWGGHP